MLNLCKMELYRLKKTKTAWVITALFILSGIIDVIFTVKLEKSDIDICKLETTEFGSKITLMFLGILLAGYIAGEYKDGFIKSVAGQISHKGMLALSKIIMTVMYTLFIFVMDFITITITSFIISKNVTVSFGFHTQYIILWLTIFIIHISISCLFVFIAVLTRSSSWGIGITLFISFDMTSLLYIAINMLIEKMGIKSVDISEYMLDANLTHMVLGVSNDYIVRSLLVGVLFMVLMVYAGIKIQHVKDI